MGVPSGGNQRQRFYVGQHRYLPGEVTVELNPNPRPESLADSPWPLIGEVPTAPIPLRPRVSR